MFWSQPIHEWPFLRKCLPFLRTVLHRAHCTFINNHMILARLMKCMKMNTKIKQASETNPKNNTGENCDKTRAYLSPGEEVVRDTSNRVTLSNRLCQPGHQLGAQAQAPAAGCTRLYFTGTLCINQYRPQMSSRCLVN
ncbi:hypothetical protein J6590_105216 [Homalodisca vitripennis]|nr:hypothetical protein J6590_105216 [Homalodisca vitripennis]